MCKDQIQHCVKTDICRADTQRSFKLDQFLTHLVAKNTTKVRASRPNSPKDYMAFCG